MSTTAFRASVGALRGLRSYHQHEAVGLEQLDEVGKDSAFVLVSNHSLATYDAFLIGLSIYERWGRVVRAILDRHLLGIPVLGQAFRDIGLLQGDREAVVEALRTGSIVGVSPGGMRESLRPSTQKREIDWAGRTGFLRVAMQTGVPVVLSITPRGDDIFDVADSVITRYVYQQFRLPLPFFRGLGPTPIPRPVKLTTYLSAPIYSPVPPDQVTEESVLNHHADLAAQMTKMLKESEG